MDRGSSSFSQRLRALTSRPDGDADTPAVEADAAAAGAQPAAPADPQVQPDEQPTGEFEPVAGPTPPAPRPQADAAPVQPPAPTPPADDDAATIEWRAIRLPEQDGPTLDPPKLQKPSKTPRPAGETPAPTPAPEPEFAKPETVADPAPEDAASAQPEPQDDSPSFDWPAPTSEPDPEPIPDLDVAPAAEGRETTTEPTPEAPAPDPAPDAEGQFTAVWDAVEQPAGAEPDSGKRSLWGRRSRRNQEQDPDIVSVGGQAPSSAGAAAQPDAGSTPAGDATADVETPEQTSSLTAALRRFKPSKPGADAETEPDPGETTPEPAVAAAAVASEPQQQEPQPEAAAPLPVPDKPSFAERAALRRRAKSLRARRDSGLLELGAIVLDVRRFGDASGGTLTRKRTDELADLDNELAEIEIALGEDRSMTAVEALGIARCSSCSSLIGPRDSFCSQCGTPRSQSDAGQPAS